MAEEEVRATIHGRDAQLGVVRARDVARLLVGMEAVIAAGAYASVGRPRRGTTGRHRAAIEAASALRFKSVEAADLAEEQGVNVANLDQPLGDWSDQERDDLIAGLADLHA